tara:strand:- start:336 stop:1376 length:1041 start_codon:yes stop_codon:yes gene_type:complete
MYYETFEDGIMITLKSLQKYSDNLFPILDLVINEPNLEENEFSLCKRNAINYLIKSRENPFNTALENWRRITYVDHPYSNDTNGYLKDIENINYLDILDEYDDFKSRERTFLSNSITKIYPQINTDEFNSKNKLENNSKISKSENCESLCKISTHHLDSNQVVLMIGNQTCPQYSKDYLILKLLESHLSFGMSSQLFKKLREDKGLTYEQGIYYPRRMQNAPFVIYLSASNQNALEAYKQIIEILEDIKTNLLKEKDIKLAKNKLYGFFLHTQQTLEERIIRKAQLIGFQLDLNFDLNLLSNLKNIKPEDIRETARKYFSKPILSIVGKEELNQKIRYLWEKETNL